MGLSAESHRTSLVPALSGPQLSPCLGCLFGYSLLVYRVSSGFINGEDKQISPPSPVPALAKLP